MLLIAIACYLIAGLWGRAPWKSADLEGLALILTLSETGDLWLLRLAQLIELESGPLVWWVGALSVWIFGPWVGDIAASRIPQGLWLSLLLISIWSSAKALASRHGAQPVELPFGGQPSVSSYSQTLADGAVLLVLASVGLVWHSHETSTALPTLGFQALGLLACVRMLDRPVKGAIGLGLAWAGCLLCAGLPGLMPLALGSAAAFVFVPRLRATGSKALLFSVPIATSIVGLIWAIPLGALHPETSTLWWQNQWQLIALPSWIDWLGWAKDLPWFWWPLWPLAIYGIWRWRHYLAHAHIGLPLVFAVAALASSAVVKHSQEAQALAAIPALALLSSLSLPTLQRSWRVALNGFSISIYTVAAALTWLGWIAITTGWPPRIAANFERQTPGFESAFSWPVFLVALGLTAFWVAVCFWRLRERKPWLLREPAIAAAGLVVSWTLLMMLWLPSLNYARSYEAMALELRAHLPAAPASLTAAPSNTHTCIRAVGLSRSHHAALKVHASLELTAGPQICNWLLLQSTPQEIDRLQQQTLEQMGSTVGSESWTMAWEGQRIADRRERFRLLKREPISP